MSSLVELTTHYGPWVLFLIIFLESLGAPVPGETGLIASGLLAAAGQVNVFFVLGVAFLAAVLGDSTGYAIGHFGGRKVLIRIGKRVKLTPARLKKFEDLLNSRGFYFVVVARFIVVARQLNGIIAGSGKMRFYKFLTANIIGAALWSLVWGGGPYAIKMLFG